MMNVEQFIEHCQTVTTEYKAGKLSLNTAAAKINASVFEYPFEGPAHPMVYKVADLAFDIAEDYRSEKDDKADWALLTGTLNKYIIGNWEPTCWMLGAMYGEYSGQKLTHSYSVSVRRQNGKTLVETASKELNNVATKLSGTLNVEQTDERYLQNLAKLIPEKVSKYKLANVEVAEYLTEPYYSTNMGSNPSFRPK
jgi:hypothetical protein